MFTLHKRIPRNFITAFLIPFLVVLITNTASSQTLVWGAGASSGNGPGTFDNSLSNTAGWTAESIYDTGGNRVPGNALFQETATGVSQGAYWGSHSAMNSPSIANGAVIFDSDYLDNNGNLGAVGTGSSPSVHAGRIVSPSIDLTGYTDSVLVIKAYVYYSESNIQNLTIGFSTNGGTSWTDLDIRNYIPAGNEYEGWVAIPFNNVLLGAFNLSNCKIRVQFEGAYNFFMLDDLSMYISNTKTYYKSITAQTCGSYTSPSGNYTWTTSGYYTDTVHVNNYSDSIYIVDLTVLGATSSTITPSVCYSYTSPSGNYTWTTSGIYTDTIPNTASCDSIITVDLTILQASSSTISPLSCTGSYTGPSGNYTWTTSGIYTDTIPNAANCDSVITINLTIGNTPATVSITEVACGSYTSPSGKTWQSSGTYQDTISTSLGCDSVLAFNLTILQATSATISITVCDTSYTSPSGNYTWTTSGIYADTISNAATCDSILSIELTVTNTNSGIDTSSLGILAALQDNATYQWIDCDGGNVPVTDATNQTFEPADTGSYAVTITNGGCTVTSLCYYVTPTSTAVEELEWQERILMYPTPNHGQFVIDLSGLEEPSQIVITDLAGRQVKTISAQANDRVQVDLIVARGMYLVHITSVDGTPKAIFKVIKE